MIPFIGYITCVLCGTLAGFAIHEYPDAMRTNSKREMVMGWLRFVGYQALVIACAFGTSWGVDRYVQHQLDGMRLRIEKETQR